MRSKLIYGGHTPLLFAATAALMNSSTFASASAHAGYDGLPDPNHVGGSGSIREVMHDNQAMTAIDGGSGTTSAGSGNDVNSMIDGDILGSAADGADDSGHSQRQLC